MSNDREGVIPLDEERMNELQVYFKDINLRIDLAKEIDKLQKENIKYKEVLDKIKEYIKEEKEEYEKGKENYKRIGIEDYTKGQLVAYNHILELLEEVDE